MLASYISRGGAMMCLALAPSLAGANDSLPELVVVGGSPAAAEFIAAGEDGLLRFRTVDGKAVVVESDRLVRWSTPASPRASDELLLADGSRFCLAPAWGTGGSIELGRDRGSAETRLAGRALFERSHVLAVLWGLPPDDGRRQEIIDRLLAGRKDKADALLLDNDDILTGRLIRIGRAERTTGDEGSATAVVFESALGRVELPVERVRGVAMSPAVIAKPAAALTQCVVGLRDGSRILADSFVADESRLVVTSASLGAVRGRDIRDVAYLQSAGNVAYLSDLAPSDYHHEPYLELEWPYRMDRNVLGGPLMVGGRRYLKGVGMHTAARITYPIDPAYDRFAATIAIDDAARDGVSVTFRVMLREGGGWRIGYECPPVRGGDEPRGVSVDLASAQALALVVDYGERGDERDYADWLDARLERKP